MSPKRAIVYILALIVVIILSVFIDRKFSKPKIQNDDVNIPQSYTPIKNIEPPVVAEIAKPQELPSNYGYWHGVSVLCTMPNDSRNLWMIHLVAKDPEDARLKGLAQIMPTCTEGKNWLAIAEQCPPQYK